MPEEKEKEIVITYETLFEILRREKAREELQKLNDGFFDDVKKYLGEKKSLLNKPETDEFSELETEKLKRQIVNMKKLVKELYERREKKIMAIALMKSRIGQGIVDTSALLPEEKMTFDLLVNIFNNARQEVLHNVFDSNGTPRSQETALAEPSQPKSIKMDAAEAVEKAPKEAQNPTDAAEQPGEAGTKKVKFLCSVPQFVGPNLEIYGPFNTDDVANLPDEVCDVLIEKRRASETDEKLRVSEAP